MSVDAPMKRPDSLPFRMHWPRTTWFGLVAASALFMLPLLFAPWLTRLSGAGNAGGWHPFGLRGESVLALTAADVDGKSLYYAQTASGLWRKTGGADGEDWRRIDAGLPRSTLGAPLLAAWSSVPGRPLQVYALAGLTDARQLFRSADGGSTWHLINVAPGDSPSPALAVLPGADGGPDAIMIATPSRLWRSLDGGANWQAAGAWPQRVGATDRAAGGQTDVVRELLVDQAAPDRILAVAQSGGLWLSENAGLSWHIVGLQDYQVTAAAFSNAALWAASAGPTAAELIYSADDAATWQTRTVPALAPSPLYGAGGVVALQAEPGIADSLYAAVRGGRVYRTVDGGTTWELLGAPGATRVTALAVEPRVRSMLYAATEDGVWARPVVPVIPTATPPPTSVPPSPTEPAAAVEPATATETPAPTVTATETWTPTVSATATATTTGTATATVTATATRTASPTRRLPTATRLPSATPRPSTSAQPTSSHVAPTQPSGGSSPVPPTVPVTTAPQGPTATPTTDYLH